MNMLPALNPVVRVFDNPLCVADGDLEFLYDYTPTIGSWLREHIPPGCGRAVLVVNGVPLFQREWTRMVLPGDQIEWHILAGGRGGSRAILTIIAAIAIAYFTAGLGASYGPIAQAAVSVALSLAAGLLINALIPIKSGGDNTPGNNTPGSVYNTSLASNQARLNQPIPVIYGRMRIYPDLAAQPYAKYKQNDQYYYALFCIGQGEYAIEALQIDDTPISNFQGVSYKILGPGVAPTQVRANIVTSIEVAGNKLEAEKPIGGFIVCRALQTVTKLEFDFAAEQGLGQSDNAGVITDFTVTVQVNIRYVDDFGVPTGDWAKLGEVALTAHSRTPQRFTFGSTLVTAGRVMVQMLRLTPTNDSNLVLDEITWTGLRGQLSASAPLCATATYLEVVMKASEQLNGITQRKVNAIVRRKLRTINATGFNVGLVETRGICDAICDTLSDTTYGASRPNGEIDFATYYALGLTYAERQDRLDVLFDSRTTVKDALRTMAQVGRAVPMQRLGVFTLMRDQYQPLPMAVYSTRDIIPGTTAINYALVTPETPDAINYEYFNNRSWDWVKILCKSPGVVTPVNTVTLRVVGVTGAFQALREGTYLAAVGLYRRQFPKWQTEMKGLLAAYGSPVVYSPALPSWGQPGDIVQYNDATLVAMLSEPPTWTAGGIHYITLEKPNGSLSIAIPVTPGPTVNEVQLTLDPGFIPDTAESDKERTKYVFGVAGQHQRVVRLLGVGRKGKSANGNLIVELMGVTENNLVHTADNAYLPAGGVIQDPVPSTTIDTAVAGAGSSGITLQSHAHDVGAPVLVGDPAIGGGIRFSMFDDGTAGYKTYSTGTGYDAVSGDVPALYPGEWVAADALEPNFSSKYEARVRVTAAPGFPLSFSVPFGLARTSSVFDDWVNLGALPETYWEFGVSAATVLDPTFAQQPYFVATFTIEIRKVGAAVNVITATISANIFYLNGSTGGIGAGDSS